MGDANRFPVLQLELWRSEGGHARPIDVVYLQPDDISRCPSEAMGEISRRAQLALPGGAELRRVCYRDGDGDLCTLAAETLADAMTFAAPVSSVAEAGRLELHVFADGAAAATAGPPGSPGAALAAPEPAEPAEPDEPDAGPVLRELHTLARGLELAEILPKFAGAALRVIEIAEQPPLFQLIQTLLDFQEGLLTVKAIPKTLPAVVAAAGELPPEVLLDLVDRFREEAAGVVEAQLAALKASRAVDAQLAARKLTADFSAKPVALRTDAKSTPTEAPASSSSSATPLTSWAASAWKPPPTEEEPAISPLQEADALDDADDDDWATVERPDSGVEAPDAGGGRCESIPFQVQASEDGLAQTNITEDWQLV